MSGCVCLATRKIWRKLQIKHSQRTQLLSFGTYCHGNMLLSRHWSWQISRRQLSCENDCTSWNPIAIRRACWYILGNRKPYLLYQPPQHSHSGNLNSSLNDKLSKLLLGIWIRLTRLGEIRKYIHQPVAEEYSQHFSTECGIWFLSRQCAWTTALHQNLNLHSHGWQCGLARAFSVFL